jgi:lipopolysaccharide biosynthesis glycosyltransferase
MTQVDVCCAAEGRYVAHSAAMLHSVLACHVGASVVIHYLHGPALPNRLRRKLAHMVEQAGGRIDLHEIPDEWCAGLPVSGFTRKATWYRIFAPELLTEVDRVLYLDADLIVLDSLTPLWKLDMGESLVGAVTNVFEPRYMDRPSHLGMSDPAMYFNAGVLLMNLGLMRERGSSAELYEYAREHAGQLLWRDQDALNAVLSPHRLSLHPRWNCMNSVMLFPWSNDVFGATAVAEARSHPAIRHFEGPSINKPWHYLSDPDQRKLYYRHRRQTPWPHVHVEGRTPRNVWRRVRRRGQRGAAQGLDLPSVKDR